MVFRSICVFISGLLVTSFGLLGLLCGIILFVFGTSGSAILGALVTLFLALVLIVIGWHTVNASLRLLPAP